MPSSGYENPNFFIFFKENIQYTKTQFLSIFRVSNNTMGDNLNKFLKRTAKMKHIEFMLCLIKLQIYILTVRLRIRDILEI